MSDFLNIWIPYFVGPNGFTIFLLAGLLGATFFIKAAIYERLSRLEHQLAECEHRHQTALKTNADMMALIGDLKQELGYIQGRYESLIGGQTNV